MALLASFGPAGAVTYTYDQLGRVTEADYGGGKTVTYAYDAAGNRTLTVAAITSPAFSIAPASVDEGGVMTFTVTKTGRDAVTYGTTSGTLTFADTGT